MERLWSSAGAVSSSSAGGARTCRFRIAQELVARRLGERAKDDSSSSAGYETVAALTAAMIAGTPRSFWATRASRRRRRRRRRCRRRRRSGTVRRRATRRAARRRRATHREDPTALRRDIESVMEDKPSSVDANRRGGRGSPSRAAAGIPEWLRDAVVETRDERMFRATWAAAGGTETATTHRRWFESTTSRIVIGRVTSRRGGGERARGREERRRERGRVEDGEDGGGGVWRGARGRDRRAMERGDAGWSRRLGRAVDDTFAMAIVVGWNHIARARDVRLLSVRRSSLRARRSLLALARLVKRLAR